MCRKQYGIILFFILCVILSSSTSAISPEVSTSQNKMINGSLQEQNGKIPVGILVMQTGFVSDIGTEYQRAFEMVQQDHPDSPIIPVIMDAGSNASTAASGWKIMSSEYPNVSVVVTVASWTTNVVYPDAADSGLVQIALGSAAVNRSSPVDRLVRFTPGVEQESPVLASYLDQFDRIVILGGDNDYSRGYVAALKSLIPDKVAWTVLYDPNNLNSTLDLTEVNENNPDAILLLSVSEAGTVAEMIRNWNITVPLIGTRVLERNALLENPAAKGLVFTTPALNSSDPFFSRYRDTYGEESTFYGAEGFDAMNTLYAAVDACGNDTDCLVAWYENHEYDGSLGAVQFDEKRVAFYPIELRIIRDGKFELYSDMKTAP